MCGRYVLQKELAEIEHLLDAMARDYGEYRFNYNVAPSQQMPVMYLNEEGERVLERMKWGFVGWKLKESQKPKMTPINSRNDRLLDSRMWRPAIEERRCVVPMSGFYEFTGPKGKKVAHYFKPTDTDMYFAAGLFSWHSVDPELKSYSVITTNPNSLVDPIHDRMPAFLRGEEIESWLNPDHTPEYHVDMLQPYPVDVMETYIASPEAASWKPNHPGLIVRGELF